MATSQAIDLESRAPEKITKPSSASPPSSFLHRIKTSWISSLEYQGIERTQEDEREETHPLNNFFLWFSANLAIPTVTIGLLSRDVFDLSFKESVAVEFCFGLVGAVLPAFIATLGPKTGLRSIIIVRFSCGYIGGIIFSVISVFSQIAWSFSSLIFAGQVLAFVGANSDGVRIPIIAGIGIVAVLCFIPCFVGYNLIHTSERYLWMPLLVLSLLLWGLGARAGFDLGDTHAPTPDGRSLVSGILGFGGVVFGNTAAWSSIAADYNCKLPAKTPQAKVFVYAFFGFFLPCFFQEMLGSALGTIHASSYVDSYTGGQVGRLLSQILSPWGGFGSFILVLLALTPLSAIILSTYSAGLAVQALGRPFAKLPRMFWTAVAWIIYTVTAIAGRDHFSEILSNLLAVMGYWNILLIVTVIGEHFIFRRRGSRLGGYDLESWDTPCRLPIGIAGITACLFGVVGAVMGMSEVWFTGPVARRVNPPVGGDLGFELAAVFCAFAYTPMRWVEIRFAGR